MGTSAFDPALVRRYDRRGPRYTSYPSAVEFHEGFGPEDYAAAVRSAPPDAPLSVYVHIPFCRSLCYYCGCHKIVTRNDEAVARYADYLLREARLQGELHGQGRPLAQLHLGGGTPTWLDPEGLGRLVAGLGEVFPFAAPGEREFSIEVDPRTADPSVIGALAGIGFNRLSLGIQDFDPVVQQAINRIQGEDETLALISAARDEGFRSVSVDLIYGLPRQNAQGFARTLDTVAAARPDRISVYSYAHLPSMFRAQRLIRDEDLPTGPDKLALLELAVSRLEEAGYEYIGMDHFALPDDELVRARDSGGLHRNFQGYSTRAGLDLTGLGISAIGSVGGCYAQNHKDRRHWYVALDEGRLPIARGLRLSERDLLTRRVIQDLMCTSRVDKASVGADFAVDFDATFAEALEDLEPMAADGLVEVGEDDIRVTRRGRYLLRALAMPFDARLPRRTEPTRFSKVV